MLSALLPVLTEPFPLSPVEPVVVFAFTTAPSNSVPGLAPLLWSCREVGWGKGEERKNYLTQADDLIYILLLEPLGVSFAAFKSI